MSICTEDDWTMDLVKFRLDSERERFFFRELTIDNEDIRGKVYDSRGNFVADLMGTCSPLGFGKHVASLTFFFTARGNRQRDVELSLFGWAIQLPDRAKPVFRGGFMVLGAASSPGTPGVPVNFDEGDTGTGSGMQAQF